MRTTLILDDEVFRRAKERAAETGMTLSEFTSATLRGALMGRAEADREERFVMPTFGGAGCFERTPVELAALRDEGN